ncbi:MAG: hypothetical protein ABSG41_26955, partial [Bryobacteraceae bacterium]
MKRVAMRKSGLFALFVLTGIMVAGQEGRSPAQDTDVGFSDTPLLPGLRYHVHDPLRPHPKVVTPGALAAQPP